MSTPDPRQTTPSSHDCIGCPYATGAERERRICSRDGRLSINLATRVLTYDDAELAVTPVKARIMAAFIRWYGLPVSIDHLALAAWGDKFGTSGCLRVHIQHLRRLFTSHEWPLVIENRRSGSYRLMVASDP